MEKRIKKIKLNDGLIFTVFDEGALRLNKNNEIITGNSVVDNAIFVGHLTIKEIDNVPIEETTEMVLVTDENGNIKQENIKLVLKNLNLITANVIDGKLELEKLKFNLNSQEIR